MATGVCTCNPLRAKVIVFCNRADPGPASVGQFCVFDAGTEVGNFGTTAWVDCAPRGLRMHVVVFLERRLLSPSVSSTGSAWHLHRTLENHGALPRNCSGTTRRL